MRPLSTGLLAADCGSSGRLTWSTAYPHSDNSEIKGEVAGTEIGYDYLVYAVGAENQTFGIKGVNEHACFLKEVWDAEKIRGRIMDCIEAANFAGQPQSEIDRLLSFVSHICRALVP